MKNHISLKLFVTLAFLLLGATLVIGYSLLSAHYYRLGMDSVTASNMEGAGRSYAELVPQARRKPLENFRGYQIASSWEELPRQLQNMFSTQPTEPGLTVKVVSDHWFQRPDSIYFVYRYQEGDENIFVIRHGSRATAPPLIGLNAAKSKHMLLAISVSIAGIIGGVILLLMRRVSRPVASLGGWARSLNSESLRKPAPDFSYPELNDLAGLIKTSLSSVQESLDREHSFLRHASHELRTPITIIRNNIELLHKIENTPSPQQAIQQAKVIERIDRASINMQHLTETLLWLSRKEVETLPAKELELDSMLEELVENLKYLLDRKEIELHLETSPYLISLPETPTEIVLGNLIRNAFQHTWEGSIHIQQQGNQVIITNSQSPANSGQDDLGFGLGLQLTTKLIKKLNWTYADESTTDIHKASIIFENEYPKTAVNTS